MRLKNALLSRLFSLHPDSDANGTFKTGWLLSTRCSDEVLGELWRCSMTPPNSPPRAPLRARVVAAKLFSPWSSSLSSDPGVNAL